MIARFLLVHWWSVSLATILAFILGGISALLGILLGPAIQLLLNSPRGDDRIALVDLFGERLAPLVAKLVHSNELVAAEFFSALPWLLVVLGTVKLLSGSGQWFLWERLGEILSRDLRGQIMKSYLQVRPQAALTDPELGSEISSLLTTDIRYLREYLVRFYGGLPREGLQIVFLTVFLYLLSAKLFFICIFGITPVGIILARLGKRLRRRAKVVLEDYQQLAEWIQLRLLGVETIKHYRMEEYEIANMKVRNRQLQRSLFRTESIKALTGPLVELVGILTLGGVLYIALAMLVRGEISGAVQLSFFGNVVLLSQAGGKLGKYFNSNREASAALKRLLAALKRFEQSAASKSNTVSEASRASLDGAWVRCDNLSFAYPGRSQLVLDHFSYQFFPGKFYCIAGTSGAGKSTLMRLMTRILEPLDGRVVMEGPTGCPSHRLMGYLPQKMNLIAATLAENVCYPDALAGCDGKKISDVLDRVGLSSLVQNLDQGIYSPVGDGQRRFSGGQEQRIGLARLLYHEYPIFMIDEGTSALDPETETLIYRSLQAHARAGGLVIMIAHRDTALACADEILRLG